MNQNWGREYLFLWKLEKQYLPHWDWSVWVIKKRKVTDVSSSLRQLLNHNDLKKFAWISLWVLIIISVIYTWHYYKWLDGRLEVTFNSSNFLVARHHILFCFHFRTDFFRRHSCVSGTVRENMNILILDRRIETHSGRPVSPPTRSTVSEENGLWQGWTTPLDQTIPPPNFARWTHGSVTHLISRKLVN